MPTNLKTLYGDRYKVQDDGTDDADRAERIWCQEIPGRYGAIYPHGQDGTLAVRVDSPRVAAKFQPLGLRAVQSGDRETVFVFETKLLDQVAALIHARRRRRLSPEQRARQAAVLTEARKRLARPYSKPISACLGGSSGGQEPS